MSKTLLHLIQDSGQPAPPHIQTAVARAYSYITIRFKRVDDAVLAGIAESVAATICRKADEIRSPNQYALAAMIGKTHQWLRSHPLIESPATQSALEVAAGAADDYSFGAAENAMLFERMKEHLSQRDRQILILIEQELDTPTAVASMLGLSYDAAKKALQRTREKMSSLLKPVDNGITRSGPLRKSYRFPHTITSKIKT